MWSFTITLLLIFYGKFIVGDEDPDLYYYGIEESERSLPACEERQACSALIQRYWRPTALVRLCRCARRQKCDVFASHDRRVEINNRAHLQFCHPISDWPICSLQDIPLTVKTSYSHMNPEKLEEMHHQNMHLVPPKITFTCRCRYPNYWNLYSANEDSTIFRYKCSSLPICQAGELCGHVTSDLNALYQSCMCHKRHICVHSGGLPNQNITELLYRGTGWKATCQKMDEEYSYDDY